MSRVGGKYRDRKRNKPCVCAWCKTVFMATREDAKTCSARCRKAWSRFTSEPQESVTVVKRSIAIKSRSSVVGQLELEDNKTGERFFYSVKN